MKVLLCHNYYQQPGGEDQVFADERQLLESHGHQVVCFTRHNDAIDGMSRLAAARRTIFNRETYRELGELIRAQRPDVMHCTNTFPLISPAAYYAANAAGVPVVQSLHNFRLLCPNALLLRDNRACEDCLGRWLAWPAVRHACYRGSRAASAVVAATLAIHWARRTWTRRVDAYIALTDFARQKFIAGGLPAQRIAVKPNFVAPDPGVGRGDGGYAVFVGRLAEEKGVRVLLDAWRQLGGSVPLHIVGDGPLAELVREAAAADPAITWRGRLPPSEVLPIVAAARGLVLPSICYENFPKTLVEAFAAGTPVIASRGGALPDLVDDGANGLLFTSGDGAALAETVRRLFAGGCDIDRLRRHARQTYEAKYTAAANYEILIDIYRQAAARAGATWPAPTPPRDSAAPADDVSPAAAEDDVATTLSN